MAHIYYFLYPPLYYISDGIVHFIAISTANYAVPNIPRSANFANNFQFVSCFNLIYTFAMQMAYECHEWQTLHYVTN